MHLYNADEVRALRDKDQVSIYEAKEKLEKERLLFKLENTYTIDGLRDILRHVIQRKFSGGY